MEYVICANCGATLKWIQKDEVFVVDPCAECKEDERQPDPPTRLRNLAQRMEDTAFEISMKDRNGDLIKLAQQVRVWADELEKEG